MDWGVMTVEAFDLLAWLGVLAVVVGAALFVTWLADKYGGSRW